MMKFSRFLKSCIPKNSKKNCQCTDDESRYDLLPHIPSEVVTSVFSFLEYEEVEQYVRVSKTWRDAAPHIHGTGILLDKRRGDQKLKSAMSCFGGNLTSVHFKCASMYVMNASLLRSFLYNAPKITRFGFEGRYRYYHVSSFFEPLVEADGLVSLKLDRCAFGNVQTLICLLEHKENLKVLHLNDIHIGEAYFSGLKDCALLAKQLKKLHSLEELDLSRGWRKDFFSKEDLQSKLPHLKKVNIGSDNSFSLKSAWWGAGPFIY